MRRRHQMPTLTRPANCIVLALLTVQAIQEKIGELADRAQAIVDTANEEKRDLTDDEKSEIDGILGVGAKGKAGYVPGTIDTLENDLQRATKLEARQAALAASRHASDADPPRLPAQRSDGPAPPGDGDGDPAGRIGSVVVPRSQIRSGRLKAYTGDRANESAYLAGQWALATLGRSELAAQWCRDHGVDVSFRGALSGDSNPGGGFLVPSEMEQAVIDLREEYGIARRLCRVVPMAGDTKNQPYRKTGLTAYFVADNDEITASDKTWGNAQLVAKKLGALCKYSSEISEDSIISMADDLAREMAYAFAVKEDACLFNGDGTSTYGGIVGLTSAVAAGSIQGAASGNVSFATLDLADFEATAAKLPLYPGIQPSWFISQVGYWGSMARLMDALGGNTITDVADGPRRLMFLGYPVVISQSLPSTDTVSTIQAYFGDLRLATLLGDRRGMKVKVSEDRYMEFDQIGILGTTRFDLVVHSTGDASNAGAVVALKTAAS